MTRPDARDLHRVPRLEQTCRRLDDHRVAYASDGGLRATLVHDDAGLVVDYPGIAVRVA